jgi:uncharacterized membrane protein
MLAFRNGYPVHLYVAITFYSPDTCGGDGGDFEARGWWSIPPGGRAVVYGHDLEDLNRYWYYYAEADDGAKWSGPYDVLVSNKAFDLCYGAVSSADDPDRYIGMRELDIGDNDDYTVTLVP